MSRNGAAFSRLSGFCPVSGLPPGKITKIAVSVKRTFDRKNSRQTPLRPQHTHTCFVICRRPRPKAPWGEKLSVYYCVL